MISRVFTVDFKRETVGRIVSGEKTLAELSRELVNFRSTVRAQTAESQLDWREGANDDLVLALAIASWQAERNLCLGFSCSYAVSEFDGRAGL